jgi:hypothetical protein
MDELYDTDLVTWSRQQAELLRRRADGHGVNEGRIDWPNLAEEIDSVGKAEERELASRIGNVLEHLFKLEASPATEPRAGWRATVRRERQAIERLLKASPSLRPTIPAVVEAEASAARQEAAASLADNAETSCVNLGVISFSADQVLGDWLPGLIVG